MATGFELLQQADALRRMRQQQTQQGLGAPDQGGAAPEMDTTSFWGELGRGAGASLRDMGAKAMTGIGGVADALGADEFARHRYRDAQRIGQSAQQAGPRIGSLSELSEQGFTLRNIRDFVGGALGSAVPSLAVAGAASIGSRTPLGAIARTAAAFTPLEAADVMQRHQQASGNMQGNLSNEQLGHSLMTGATSAVAQSLVPALAVSRLRGTTAGPTSLRNALGTVGLEAGTEAAAEGGSEAFKQLAVNPQAPVNWTAVTDAAASGAIGGAGVSAAGQTGAFAREQVGRAVQALTPSMPDAPDWRGMGQSLRDYTSNLPGAQTVRDLAGRMGNVAQRAGQGAAAVGRGLADSDVAQAVGAAARRVGGAVDSASASPNLDPQTVDGLRSAAQRGVNAAARPVGSMASDAWDYLRAAGKGLSQGVRDSDLAGTLSEQVQTARASADAALQRLDLPEDVQQRVREASRDLSNRANRAYLSLVQRVTARMDRMAQRKSPRAAAAAIDEAMGAGREDPQALQDALSNEVPAAQREAFAAADEATAASMLDEHMQRATRYISGLAQRLRNSALTPEDRQRLDAASQNLSDPANRQVVADLAAAEDARGGWRAKLDELGDRFSSWVDDSGMFEGWREQFKKSYNKGAGRPDSAAGEQGPTTRASMERLADRTPLHAALAQRLMPALPPEVQQSPELTQKAVALVRDYLRAATDFLNFEQQHPEQGRTSDQMLLHAQKADQLTQFSERVSHLLGDEEGAILADVYDALAETDPARREAYFGHLAGVREAARARRSLTVALGQMLPEDHPLAMGKGPRGARQFDEVVLNFMDWAQGRWDAGKGPNERAAMDEAMRAQIARVWGPEQAQAVEALMRQAAETVEQTRWDRRDVVQNADYDEDAMAQAEWEADRAEEQARYEQQQDGTPRTFYADIDGNLSTGVARNDNTAGLDGLLDPSGDPYPQRLMELVPREGGPYDRRSTLRQSRDKVHGDPEAPITAAALKQLRVTRPGHDVSWVSLRDYMAATGKSEEAVREDFPQLEGIPSEDLGEFGYFKLTGRNERDELQPHDLRAMQFDTKAGSKKDRDGNLRYIAFNYDNGAKTVTYAADPLRMTRYFQREGRLSDIPGESPKRRAARAFITAYGELAYRMGEMPELAPHLVYAHVGGVPQTVAGLADMNMTLEPPVERVAQKLREDVQLLNDVELGRYEIQRQNRLDARQQRVTALRQQLGEQRRNKAPGATTQRTQAKLDAALASLRFENALMRVVRAEVAKRDEPSRRSRVLSTYGGDVQAGFEPQAIGLTRERMMERAQAERERLRVQGQRLNQQLQADDLPPAQRQALEQALAQTRRSWAVQNRVLTVAQDQRGVSRPSWDELSARAERDLTRLAQEEQDLRAARGPDNQSLRQRLSRIEADRRAAEYVLAAAQRERVAAQEGGLARADAGLREQRQTLLRRQQLLQEALEHGLAPLEERAKFARQLGPRSPQAAREATELARELQWLRQQRDLEGALDAVDAQLQTLRREQAQVINPVRRSVDGRDLSQLRTQRDKLLREALDAQNSGLASGALWDRYNMVKGELARLEESVGGQQPRLLPPPQRPKQLSTGRTDVDFGGNVVETEAYFGSDDDQGITGAGAFAYAQQAPDNGATRAQAVPGRADHAAAIHTLRAQDDAARRDKNRTDRVRTPFVDRGVLRSYEAENDTLTGEGLSDYQARLERAVASWQERAMSVPGSGANAVRTARVKALAKQALEMGQQAGDMDSATRSRLVETFGSSTRLTLQQVTAALEGLNNDAFHKAAERRAARDESAAARERAAARAARDEELARQQDSQPRETAHLAVSRVLRGDFERVDTLQKLEGFIRTAARVYEAMRDQPAEGPDRFLLGQLRSKLEYAGGGRHVWSKADVRQQWEGFIGRLKLPPEQEADARRRVHKLLDEVMINARTRKAQQAGQEVPAGQRPKPDERPAALAQQIKALNDAGAPAEQVQALAERLRITTASSPDAAYAAQQRYSRERTGASEPDDPSLLLDMTKYVRRVLGPKAVLELTTELNHAGQWYYDEKLGEHVLRVAHTALNPMGTAHHEAMHALLHDLRMAGLSDVARAIMAVHRSPHVMQQLRQRLKDSPEALAQLNDPEEAAAFAYQFWSQDESFTLTRRPRTLFQRLHAGVMRVLGIMSADERALHIFQWFEDGQHARGDKPDVVRQALMQVGRNKALDRLERMSAPITGLWASVATAGQARLRDMQLTAVDELADAIKPELTSENGQLGYLPAVQREYGQRINLLADALNGVDEATVAEALSALQLGTQATGRAEQLRQSVRMLLDEMFVNLRDAGVNLGDRGWGVDYFPRVWDPSKIAADPQGFRELLRRHKLPDSVMTTLLNSDGVAMHLRPEQPALNAQRERVLDVIPHKQAAPWMKDDLRGVMSSYLRQGVKRAEWARRFGANNERLNALLAQAQAQGATPEQMKVIDRYVQGVTGTLGGHMDPRLRLLTGNVMVYQNIRLLPLAIFSSIVDPMGVMVRGGTAGDAWRTFKRGIKEMRANFKKDYRFDEATEVAETLGIVESAALSNFMAEQYSEGTTSGLAKKINETFFRYNLMEQWNRSMRVGALQAAERFVQRHVKNPNEHSERYLAELGLSRDDFSAAGIVHPDAQDRYALALHRWVDGAVLRPDAADKAIWMNDHNWQVVAHFKQFVFSFQHTILDRVMHELREGNYRPALALAGYVPIVLAADFARSLIVGGGEEPEYRKRWGLADYTANAVERAGLYGVGQFSADVMRDVQHGGVGVGALGGPTINQITQGVQVLGGRREFEPFALESMPANALYRGLVD